MSELFPRTMVGGVSLPRMLMGTNWILGYSHTSAAADQLINRRNRNRDAIAEIAQCFLSKGVDAVMGPLMENPVMLDGIHQAEDKTGKQMILIDTPSFNMDDNADARREAEKVIRRSAPHQRRCGSVD